MGRADWSLEKGMEGIQDGGEQALPSCSSRQLLAQLIHHQALTDQREIRSQQCLDSWVTSTAAGGKLLKHFMASSLLQATMVRTQRELQERCQPERKQRQLCYQDPTTAISVIGWYHTPARRDASFNEYTIKSRKNKGIKICIHKPYLFSKAINT